MKKLCKIITYGLAKQLDKDQHWCNIFQYAIQVTLEKWISLTVMGLLATWFGYGKEYLLFLFNIYTTSIFWWWIAHENIYRMPGVFMPYGWRCAD